MTARRAFQPLIHRMVLVRGEAGIGKTMLVRRFCDDQRSTSRPLWGACEALFASGPSDWRWFVLLSTLLLVGGCVLGALGIVGEYVGRIYEQVKGRPIYVLKDASPELVDNDVLERSRQAA